MVNEITNFALKIKIRSSTAASIALRTFLYNALEHYTTLVTFTLSKYEYNLPYSMSVFTVRRSDG